jgi:hypothetical protein
VTAEDVRSGNIRVEKLVFRSTSLLIIEDYIPSGTTGIQLSQGVPNRQTRSVGTGPGCICFAMGQGA